MEFATGGCVRIALVLLLWVGLSACADSPSHAPAARASGASPGTGSGRTIGRRVSDEQKGDEPAALGAVRVYYRTRIIREAGGWHVRAGYGSVPLRVLACRPESRRARDYLDFYVAEECSGGSDAYVAAVGQAVQRVEEELAGRLSALGSSPARDRMASIRSSANRLLWEELDRAGVMERLEAAWARHVTGRSKCYRETMREVLRQVREAVRKEGIDCNDWTAYLRFCTTDGKEVAEHIVFEKGMDPPREVERTIDLLREAGLTYCMGRIVREDDPALAAQVLRLRPQLGQLPNMEKINRRAWRLWRRRGVDRWYEIVKREGKLPEKLRLKILQCAGGYLPPVVEGGEGKGSPALAR